MQGILNFGVFLKHSNMAIRGQPDLIFSPFCDVVNLFIDDQLYRVWIALIFINEAVVSISELMLDSIEFLALEDCLSFPIPIDFD